MLMKENLMLKKVNNTIYRIISWGLIGVIISLIFCAIILTDGLSLKRPFYDCGDVYEIPSYIYKANVNREKGYQEKSGKVVLEQGEYSYGLAIHGSSKKWNYLCITLNKLSSNSLKASVIYKKQKNEEVKELFERSYDLKEGINLLDIPNKPFNTVIIKITGKDGTTFSVEKIELREKEPVSNLWKVFKWMPIIFLIYTLFSGFIICIVKKTGIKYDFYSWIKLLQGIYILIANQFKEIRHFFSKRFLIYIRRICFLLMFIYSVVVEITQAYFDYFKYHMMIYLFLLFIIAITSIEESNKKRHWNNPLVWGWIVLIIMMCVSDFLLPKDFHFFGYGMLIVIGFYIFTWNNMKNPIELFQDFIWSIHAFFIIVVVFCLLFKPELKGIRYSGISKNSGFFALYLVTTGAVVLGSLENEIVTKNKWINIFLYVLEGCVLLTFLWKSQSAGPLLCTGLIGFIWLFRVNRYLKSRKNRKVLVKLILIAVLCIVPVYGGISWGINHIPQTLNSAVTFKGETPVARQSYGSVVYAADISEKLENTRLGQKFSNVTLSGVLSGRNYYYKAYLRNMNLFGHKERPILWGHRRKPHNSILGIAYTYGVFAAVPYIIMLIATIERTFRYSKRKVKYASVPFYVCFSSIIMSLSDNVEMPFVWLPWIGLYLMMGIVFDDSQLIDSDKELQNYSIE